MLSRRQVLTNAIATSLASALLPRWVRATQMLDPAAPDRPYLDAALAAERWIARSAIRDGTGLTWPVDPRKPESVDATLYSGSPGVVLFYLELYAVTGDARFLDLAMAGADYLIAHMPATSASLGDEGAGLYTGLAGLVYVLALTAERSRERRFASAAARGLSVLDDALTPAGDGAAWNASNDIIAGTSGILLTGMWLEQRPRGGYAYPERRDIQRRAVRRLIEAGVREHGGTTWSINSEVPRRYPNFSHGAAGVGYTLATFAMHDRKSAEAPLALGASLSAATYLDTITTRTVSNGRKIFHSTPGGEQLFYMSWCHGPAGTARFYRQLRAATGDARWAEYGPQLSQGILDSGVPETHPDRSGFWNNISQCCGNCGVAEYFAAQHVATGDASSLAFARRVMDNVIARGVTDGDAMSWPQAENRVRPENIVAQTGLMQGAAGVGLALLHLDGAIARRAPVVVLPDTPRW